MKNIRKNTLKHGLLAGMAVVVLSGAVSVLVASQQPAHAQEIQQNTQTSQEKAQTNAKERRDKAKTRLADTKLKACQKREEAITNKMTRLADRGTKQLDVFTKIAERTQAFYISKGKVLSNYDTLVADVNTKKIAAETAVDTIKNTSIEFKCDGEDPKGVVSAFKESLKAEIAALKDYKTAVKNLIVGVKSVQGTTSSERSQQ